MSTGHFDRRGATYDADKVHRRIVEILVSRTPLTPGMRVLDVATGTGAVALQAAHLVGAAGRVLGIDVSEGMLVQARRKAAEAGLQNTRFLQADAEQVGFSPAQFDCILFGSSLIFMRDIPRTLRRCLEWLESGGILALDMPAKPFGMSQWIAEGAAEHGLVLPYDTVADTLRKCRDLLHRAGFVEVEVTTETVADNAVSLEEATDFLDRRMDHPAWRALAEAPEQKRRGVRSSYMAGLQRRAEANTLRNIVALNFASGTKP